MSTRTYIRLFLLVMILACSLILLSYTRNNISSPSNDKECYDKGKCEQRTLSDFSILESISRNLLGSR